MFDYSFDFSRDVPSGWSLLTGHSLDLTQMAAQMVPNSLEDNYYHDTLMRMLGPGDYGVHGVYGVSACLGTAHTLGESYDCLVRSELATRAIGDPCHDVWPAVPFSKSRCPPGRSAAAAWSSTDGGGWIFGGQIYPQATQQMSAIAADMALRAAVTPHLNDVLRNLANPMGLLEDLWHIDFKLGQPRWRRVPMPEAAGVDSAAWPPALIMAQDEWSQTGIIARSPIVVLDAWSEADPSEEQLWFSTNANASNLSLWLFTPATEMWHHVEAPPLPPSQGSSDSSPSALWPHGCDGGKMAGGWMLGACAPAKCAHADVVPISSLDTQLTQHNTGLWRWA